MCIRSTTSLVLPANALAIVLAWSLNLPPFQRYSHFLLVGFLKQYWRSYWLSATYAMPKLVLMWKSTFKWFVFGFVWNVQVFFLEWVTILFFILYSLTNNYTIVPRKVTISIKFDPSRSRFGKCYVHVWSKTNKFEE